MNDIEEIKLYIKKGQPDKAISLLTGRLVISALTSEVNVSELYYLLGNAYRKKGDFHLAMDHYAKAIEENPDSPAAEAHKALQGIMSFYNKDMYNH